MAARLRAFVAENVNALLFAAGFVVFVSGLASYSGALAAVVAGVVVMGMSALPYVRAPRKG